MPTQSVKDAMADAEFHMLCKLCGRQDALKPLEQGQCARCGTVAVLYRCPIRPPTLRGTAADYGQRAADEMRNPSRYSAPYWAWYWACVAAHYARHAALRGESKE